MSDLAQTLGFDDALTLVDTHYYQAVPPGGVGERVLVAARNRIYQDFVRLCAPKRGESILDVGVSDVVTDGANLLERLHPHLEDVTAAGLGSGGRFRAAYPKVHYQRIEANQGLPYADRSFPIVVSNAVLEHVGGEPEQLAFVRELTRVADRVFITVPHRYFPIEHHTAIPLAHWTDTTFQLACTAFKRTEWLDRKNLILMSRRRLARLVPGGPDLRVSMGMTGLWLGPLSSNLYMLIERATHPH